MVLLLVVLLQLMLLMVTGANQVRLLDYLTGRRNDLDGNGRLNDRTMIAGQHRALLLLHIWVEEVTGQGGS